MLREKKKSHAEGHAEGLAEGRAEGEARMVFAAHRKGKSINELVDLFELPETTILEYLELGEKLST